ncbi:MAG: SEC-C domain-containing protein [Clostridium argentinense]|uniref:SEC-C domain-containing protein n=1 Tax=Clostridium faecium TaxID=2762223 RepID=A0ABR8YRU5_9CLOT|nr:MULTISPECIES: SEC-C metal-binding domain-containing protein [Clostridium]MBD8046981.1 SEC-C domain-containing protein [Clostridium faecium]MBS5823169.1 SEC-C domain-containing protein [Clostridium argentinense]MDU1349255.1 SEC-C metal-binding domain-containing protein [Clostridium argentinense]
MKLYNAWTNYVVEFVKTNGEPAFWKEYAKIETRIYSKVLTNLEGKISGKISDLAKEYEVTDIHFMGFLDGINESLEEGLDLESIEADSQIEIQINFEKLYFNMLESKADYLYNLPQWDRIFSEEKRKEITKEWRSSKVIVKEDKIGRNDPCPCGSGKKYKKCCGK